MRRKAVVIVALIVIISSIATIYCYNKSQTVLAGMEGMIATELTKALGSEVIIGGTELASLNSIVLHDVAIRDGQGALIAASGKVTAVFSTWSILSGGSVTGSVKELVLENPQIYLAQNSNRQWNIDKMVEKTRSGDSSFAGTISLKDGVVSLKTPDGQWQVTAINGSIDFSSKPDMIVKYSARFAGAPVEVAGRINQEGSCSLRAKAAGFALEDFQPLITMVNQAGKTAKGKVANLDVSVRYRQGEITYNGEAMLDGVAVDIEGMPVRDARGLVAFSEKGVRFFGTTVKIYDQSIRIGGKITIGTTEPVMNLTVSSDQFDPQVVVKDIPVSGNLSFNAKIVGKTSSPSVTGEVRMIQGTLGGYAASNANIGFSFRSNALNISRFDADMFDGHIAASADIEIQSKQFYAIIRGRGLNMSKVPDLAGKLSGRGDFDITLDGAGSIAGASAVGSFKLGAGAVEGVSFSRLSGSFSKTGDHIAINGITVSFGKGVLTARGEINDNRLNLVFEGQAIPLSHFATKSTGPILAGTANCEGAVSGTLDNPRVDARAKAYNGQVYYQPFTIAQMNFSANKDTISIEDAEFTNGTAKHKIKGTVGLSDEHNLDITVITTQARVENFARVIMPGEKITGNIDNEVRITGPAANFSAEGRVRLTEGSFRGQLLTRVEGSYQRCGNVTELKDFVVESLNNRMNFAGTITADNCLNINISAKDIDVAALSNQFPYPVAGRMSFEGNLTGTTAAPVLSGEVTAKTLSLNNHELKNIAGRIGVSGSQINIPVFSFSQKEGTISLTGGIDTKSGAVSGNLTVENGNMANLLSILNVPSKDVDGILNGRISLGGTLANPRISLSGTMTKGKIKNYPLDNIEVDVGLENNLLTINRFYANQGSGVLVVRGTANLKGPLNLEFGGRDIDAGLLTAWFDSSTDFSGKMNFTAQVAGTVRNPAASVSLEIKQGSVANASFDSMYGLFILKDHNISVNQLMFIKGPYRASIYGTVPLAALNQKGRNTATIADQMDLKMRLDHADLSILPLLTKEVSWAAGETTGEVTVAGTLAQPLLYGNFTVKKGTVKLASLADPIQNVGVDIQFEGDKINIDTFEGSMGSGTYRLTGSATLDGLTFNNYNMQLALDNLDVNHKYFKGLVNGTLSLANNGGKSVLSGKIVLDNVTADIPPIPDFSVSDRDMAMDVEVLTNNKIHLYNPYMYDLWVNGQVKFAGTTRRPDVSGKFEIVRGTVSYLRTQFKVISGGAEFTQFRSFMPVIKLDAQTNLENTKVYLTVNGPPDAMEFRLSSEPAMNQQEILMLLTLRSNYLGNSTGPSNYQNTGVGRDEVVGLLNAGLTMGFLTEAESMFRNSLNLNDFRLVRGSLPTDIFIPNDDISSTDQESYSLAVSKYVNDRLLLGYTQGLDHQGHTISFRYDLNQRISFTGLQDEQNRIRIGVETRIKF